MRRSTLKRKPRRPGYVSDASLDSLFSELVRARARYECQAWGYDGVRCSSQMQCAHIKSRRYKAIRWDPDNALCLCAAHHMHYHANPDQFARLVEDLFPGRWDELNAKLQTIQAPKKHERQDISARLRKEIGETRK